MEEFYTITIAGVTRALPICKVNEELSIAAFVIFGDPELTSACAAALLEKLPPHDIMITAEAKGIPLICEMARQNGSSHYLVARKSSKLYMKEPFTVEVKSITTEKKQTLTLDLKDAELIKNRRVVVLDDVVSTGESMKALEQLVEAAGGTIAAKAAIIAEGDAIGREDIIYLAELPLFFKKTDSPTGKLEANEGKSAAIEVDGVEYDRLPIKTHVITDKDTIPDVAEKYVKRYLKDGDILFISEKAVACSQRRAVPIKDIKPSWLAKTLCRFVYKSPYGIGLSIPPTMEIDRKNVV